MAWNTLPYANNPSKDSIDGIKEMTLPKVVGIISVDLESQYEEWRSTRRVLEFEEDAITRENFLADDLASLVCDDDELEYNFGCIIRDVVLAIADRKTFEYIDVSETNYERFIVVVNMLGFGYLDYGTSIRGCWFESTDDPNSESSQLIEFCRKAKEISDAKKEASHEA